MSSGEEVVRVNHDLEGSGAGGATPAWDVRRLWRVLKSEKRFWRVKERRGRRRVML